MPRDRDRQREYNRAYYERNHTALRATQNAWSRENREAITASRKGMTREQVDRLIVSQGGRCAICTAELTHPHLDHDHSCCPGQKTCGSCVRGALCINCNHILGKAHDNPEVLEAAAAYLRAHARSDR